MGPFIYIFRIFWEYRETQNFYPFDKSPDQTISIWWDSSNVETQLTKRDQVAYVE